MRILIADDESVNRKLLRLALKSKGHEVVEASDGAEVLKVLEREKVDALISDILMPTMDGYRLCYELRKSEAHKALPVILYSSSYLSPGDQELALRFGASAFLEKPATPEKLEEVLHGAIARPAPVPVVEPGDDLGRMKEYSERLITKIEEKNVELTRRTEELKASEEKFRQLAENIQEVFFMANADFSQVLYVSPAYTSVWGRPVEELYAQPRQWMEFILAEDRPRILEEMQRSLEASAPFSLEYRIVRPDGTSRCIHARGFPIRDLQGKAYRFAGLAEDVTARKSLELQLIQAQKMEAVGRLAGGVAHDFNNLLTAINGYSQLALQRIDARDPLYRDIEEVHKAGQRAATLTRQLLAFSRKQVLQPRVISLNAVVMDVERLLKRLIGEDVELATVLAPDLGSVRADPGQVEQVLVNLAVNARDAMPNGGRLLLETSNVELDAADPRAPADLKPGRYVLVVVTDTGTGIPDPVKEHLFEPFFTTKEPGKGTGLGLATVHGIVRQSGGHIAVESEAGRGAKFRIYLPRVDVPPEPAPRPGGGKEAWRGQETVLLVEDEPAVRALTKAVLTQAGYTVLEARRGEEALLIRQNHPGTIHLVLSDLVMPGLNGLELVRRLREETPGLRVLFMSGYTDAAIMNAGVLRPDVPFLSKPFTTEALLRGVRDALDAAGS